MADKRLVLEPWLQQPQEFVGLNLHNPAAVGLDVAYSTLYGKNAAGYGEMVPSGSPLQVAGPAGLGVQFAVGGSQSFTTTFPPLPDGTPYTLAAVVELDATTGARLFYNSDNTNREFQFRTNAGVLEFIAFNTAVSTFTAAGATLVPGVPTVVMARASTKAEVWVNGVLGGTAPSITGTLKGLGAINTIIGTRLSAGWGGKVYSIWRWPYAISNEQVAEFFKNPWNTFEPQQIWVPVPTSSGNTYTITPSGGVVFAGTGGEINTKVLATSGGVTMGGTGTMTFNSGGTTYTIVPSGGVTLGGANATVKGKVFIPSGGVSFGGTAPTVKTDVQSPSGGIIFGGTGSMTSNTTPSGSGNPGERTKVGTGT